MCISLSFETYSCVSVNCKVCSESRETIESVVVAIDPNSGLTSPTINEDLDDDDRHHGDDDGDNGDDDDGQDSAMHTSPQAVGDTGPLQKAFCIKIPPVILVCLKYTAVCDFLCVHCSTCLDQC